METPKFEQSEQRAETPEQAYELVLKDPDLREYYHARFRTSLRELQLDHDDLNFPLAESEATSVVNDLQRALDSGQCDDTDDGMKRWIEQGVRMIKRKKDRKKRAEPVTL